MVRDDEGRVVEVVRTTASDSQWLDEDIDAALEWVEFKASLCGGCGRRRTETFDPSNEERYDVEALRCHACAARDRAAKSFHHDEHADTSGIYFATTDSHEH